MTEFLETYKSDIIYALIIIGSVFVLQVQETETGTISLLLNDCTIQNRLNDLSGSIPCLLRP